MEPRRPSGEPTPLGWRTAAVVAASVAVAVTQALVAALAPDPDSGLRTGGSAFDWASDASSLALVLAFVATGLWLTEARRNVERLRPEVDQTRDAVWAWLGWIIPIVSLWFPYQVVRDVLRGRTGAPAPFLVKSWWVLFLVASTTSFTTDHHVDASSVEWMALDTTVGAVATVVALGPWLLVVRRVARDQAQLLSGTAGVRAGV
ncbi:MAG: DUF4328 domain-containing protein [Aeromicrobium erythreum]